MNITVRQLIEHLAQFDPDLQVKIADPNQPFILHDVGEHDVHLEEYVDTRAPNQTPGNFTSTHVVAIG